MTLKLCYFNQHWNIYFYSKQGIRWEDWSKNPEVSTVDTEEGQFRLRKYNHPEIPVFSFGLWLYNPKGRPGHGGEWSSNSQSINREFDTNLLEIALDQLSAAVPIDWLKAVMGNKVTWTEHDIYGYIITDVKGEENKYMKWVEIPVNELMSKERQWLEEDTQPVVCEDEDFIPYDADYQAKQQDDMRYYADNFNG